LSTAIAIERISGPAWSERARPLAKLCNTGVNFDGGAILLNFSIPFGVPIPPREIVELPPDDRPLLVVSDGIGVDSTARLIALWRLDVRLDVILHADIGEEHPLTIAYLEERRSSAAFSTG